MVDSAQRSHDIETLVLSLANARRACIERVVHQILARLAPKQTFVQTIQYATA